MNRIAIIAGLALAGTVAGSANAQLVAHKDLSVTTAVTIAQTAVQTCKSQGYNVSAHILGRAGDVLVAMRGDDTGPQTYENSFKKAWTARATRAPSLNFANTVKGNPDGGRDPSQQHGAGPGRAADHGWRRRHRRGRRVGCTRRRQGRSLRQGRARQGCGRIRSKSVSSQMLANACGPNGTQALLGQRKSSSRAGRCPPSGPMAACPNIPHPGIHSSR